MTRHFIPGDPPVEVILRRSARARRISLRVSSLDGRVTLTCPNGVSEDEALGFAREKADWMRGHLMKRPDEVVVGHGAAVPFRGRMIRIMPGTGRAIRIIDDRAEVPGAPAQAGRRMQAYLRETARARLAEACDTHARALGRPYSKLTLRDTRSRWGSCTSQGGLMFSWRLIMVPDAVLDYVAAHEVAHLGEMNHSPRFWALVERLYGDHRAARKWLRQNGPELHRYRFD
ncbi:M48 family metallopeptidase [Rhodalgimonas zhirmunskyi]|uniref:M48 family metallopeptidase n=1 Tax=Rhodalgimonas zhirmunskyi TaxID=2964767 RepID=A0AAJ1X5T2_9RHOB|nr:SprT family zinc-dependent metalloprotease [Rhodoalgimonas zhirmunskyi]MDQ2094474.1 M48 family metallopeptidase [Rhodoalgimonas zhirmunskyi]